MKNSKKERLSTSESRILWISRVIIWITIVVIMFPALWIVMSSFSAGDSFFLSSLFPKKLSLEHYVELFKETDFVLWVWNSLKMCFKDVLVSGSDSADFNFIGSICFFKTSFYRKKIRVNDIVDITSFSK